jgi:hypothetical protein
MTPSRIQSTAIMMFDALITAGRRTFSACDAGPPEPSLCLVRRVDQKYSPQPETRWFVASAPVSPCLCALVSQC